MTALVYFAFGSALGIVAAVLGYVLWLDHRDRKAKFKSLAERKEGQSER